MPPLVQQCEHLITLRHAPLVPSLQLAALPFLPSPDHGPCLLTKLHHSFLPTGMYCEGPSIAVSYLFFNPLPSSTYDIVSPAPRQAIQISRLIWQGSQPCSPSSKVSNLLPSYRPTPRLSPYSMYIPTPADRSGRVSRYALGSQLSRLHRTASALLETLHCYGWGTMMRCQKRVQHNCVI